MTLARLGFAQEEKEILRAPSLQGQPHTQPQARLLLPEPMNYYREISFPVCASSQRLPAPFTFTFSPFSPCLQLSTLWWLEIPLSSLLPIPAQPGEAKQGVTWAQKAVGGGLGRFIHSFSPQAGFDSCTLREK